MVRWQYSVYGREPWVPEDQFAKETLLLDKTPRRSSQRNDLTFRTWDLTPRLSIGKTERVLARASFSSSAEGTLFIYENRLGDADVFAAIEEGLHARYLYQVQLAMPD
jgi:hypothetical protein